jgi:putative DNA primase/helicase
VVAYEVPAFHDPSGALKRRLIVLRTKQSFFGNEDIHLTNKLLKELPGILNWSIEGLKRLWSRGHFPHSASLVKFVDPDVSSGSKEGNVT